MPVKVKLFTLPAVTPLSSFCFSESLPVSPWKPPAARASSAFWAVSSSLATIVTVWAFWSQAPFTPSMSLRIVPTALTHAPQHRWVFFNSTLVSARAAVATSSAVAADTISGILFMRMVLQFGRKGATGVPGAAPIIPPRHPPVNSVVHKGHPIPEPAMRIKPLALAAILVVAPVAVAQPRMTVVAGEGLVAPFGVDFGDDGAIYFIEMAGGERLRSIDSQGVVHTLAG